jgi:RNA polymerase sigma-70 factor (ECF subfamily)
LPRARLAPERLRVYNVKVRRIGVKLHTPKVVDWETHLVLRAQAGESVAFELLADAYRPTLYAVAYRMLRHHDDARDAVQEALLKAFRALAEFDADRPIKPWLARICSNCCVDSMRARKRSAEPIHPHEHTLQNEDQSLDERANGSLRYRAVLEAIGRLPERYRDIILMRHFRHMDVTEIASALNRPEGTIKSWLFRARAMLRKDLRVALG